MFIYLDDVLNKLSKSLVIGNLLLNLFQLWARPHVLGTGLLVDLCGQEILGAVAGVIRLSAGAVRPSAAAIIHTNRASAEVANLG